MKKNSTNPGLVFNRYYFEARYNKQLGGRPRGHQGSFKLKHLLKVSKDDEPAAKAHFELRNQHLYNYGFDPSDLKNERQTGPEDPQTSASVLKPGALTVDLRTTYPGLMVGLGYNHQVAANGAINGGFSFDHTTGLPIIPGSSVKGLLRAAFPNDDRARAKQQEAIVTKLEEQEESHERISKIGKARSRLAWYTTSANSKAALIIEILNRIAPANGDWTEEQLTPIFRALFDATYLPPEKEDKPENLLHFPIPGRAVFHPAIIVEANSVGQILGPDNITPHLNPAGLGNNRTDVLPDRYVEPNPVSFLKVLPKVTFRFSFHLPATYRIHQQGEALDVPAFLLPNQAHLLFTELLLHYGVGAKTRIGYGRLEYRAGIADWPVKERSFAAPQVPYANFSTGSFSEDYDDERLRETAMPDAGVATEDDELRAGIIVTLKYTQKVSSQYFFTIVSHGVSVNTRKKVQPNFPNALSSETPITARIDEVDDDGTVKSFTIL